MIYLEERVFVSKPVSRFRRQFKYQGEGITSKGFASSTPHGQYPPLHILGLHGLLGHPVFS